MYQPTFYSLKISEGMTLIELLFAMAFTLLICASVSTLYLSNITNHLTEAALQNIQQNARITFQLLNGVLHSVGYIGCAKLTDDFPIVFSDPYQMSLSNRIQSYQGSELKSATNAFTVRYVSSLNNTLVDAMKENDILHINDFIKVSVGDVLLISDCKTADIFVVSQVSKQVDDTQSLTTDRPLSKRYEQNAEVGLFNIDTFYIGKTDRKDSTNHPIYALYKKDQLNHKTELVEGVDDLKIRYMTKENGTILEKNSDAIMDWATVIGVSLQFYFSSLNYVPLKKIKYHDVAFRE